MVDRKCGNARDNIQYYKFFKGKSTRKSWITRRDRQESVSSEPAYTRYTNKFPFEPSNQPRRRPQDGRSNTIKETSRKRNTVTSISTRCNFHHCFLFFHNLPSCRSNLISLINIYIIKCKKLCSSSHCLFFVV